MRGSAPAGRGSFSTVLCGKFPLFPRTPITPAVGLPGYGRLPPPAHLPAPSHTPWKTLRVSHSPPASTAARRKDEGCTVLIDAAAQE